MKINYLEIAIVVVLALGLVIWLAMRNNKDEKAYEKDELKDSDLVERHDAEKKNEI